MVSHTRWNRSYNGKEFKHYKLQDGKEETGSLLNLNWLYIDTEGTLWEIGKKGRIFRYDTIHDTFILEYKLPIVENKDLPAPVSHSFIDDNHNIWLCCDETIFLYNTKSQEVSQLKNTIEETITDIAQIDKTRFFIATEEGIHYAELKGETITHVHCDKLDNIAIQMNKLYFDPKVRKLYIGTFQRGIFVYDMNTKQTTQFANYSDFSNPGNIVVDPATGDVIITDQPFSVLNDIYVYGSDGVLKKKLETGYYTTNMRFVTE